MDEYYVVRQGLIIAKSQYVQLHATASVKIDAETIVENTESFAVLGSSVGASSAVAGPSSARGGVSSAAGFINTIPLFLVNEKNGYTHRKSVSVKGKIIRMTEDLPCKGLRKRKVTIQDGGLEMDVQIFNDTVEEFVKKSPIGREFVFNNVQVNIYSKIFTLQQIPSSVIREI